MNSIKNVSKKTLFALTLGACAAAANPYAAVVHAAKNVATAESVSALSANINSWDGAYSFQGSIVNTSGKTIDGWRVISANNLSIDSIWCATASKEGDLSVIESSEWNSKLEADGTAQFGFNGTGTAPSEQSFIVEFKIDGKWVKSTSKQETTSGEVASADSLIKEISVFCYGDKTGDGYRYASKIDDNTYSVAIPVTTNLYRDINEESIYVSTKENVTIDHIKFNGTHSAAFFNVYEQGNEIKTITIKFRYDIPVSKTGSENDVASETVLSSDTDISEISVFCYGDTTGDAFRYATKVNDTNYEVVVPAKTVIARDINEDQIKIIPSNKNAKVSKIKFNRANSAALFTVTAQDNTTKTYILSIKNEENSIDSASDTSLSKVYFYGTEAVKTGDRSYTVTLPSSAYRERFVTDYIKAVPNNENAEVYGKGFLSGNYTAYFRVSAEDGTTDIYTISIVIEDEVRSR